MKFLIDECLTVKLVDLAIESGYPESAHVAWRGLAGKKDHEIMEEVLNGDWTLVTRNAKDFRGDGSKKGNGGHFANTELHAGLVCLTADPMDIHCHYALFERALAELQKDDDLINKVLEITLDDAIITIDRYNLPTSK